MQKKQLEPDSIANEKLSVILSSIKEIVKGYKNNVTTAVEESNGTPISIRFNIEIFLK